MKTPQHSNPMDPINVLIASRIDSSSSTIEILAPSAMCCSLAYSLLDKPGLIGDS